MKIQVGLSVKEYEPVNCAVCGTSNLKRLTSTGEFGWKTFVSICKDCGFVFLSPRWTSADYKRFYLNEYDEVLRADPEKVEEKEKRKAKIVWKRIQPYLPNGKMNVLDIGCGMGWALQLVHHENPKANLFAIEPSKRYQSHVREVIGAEIISSDVDENWHLHYSQFFDLIIMRHVIEHLLDPVSALEKISHVLSPRGIYYMATPDMMHPDGSLNRFWYRAVHTYYFSKVPMQRVAAKAKLEPLTLRSENSELWGIFRRNEQVSEPIVSVYRDQMAVLRRYKVKRFLRWLIRLVSPGKISKMLPKTLKEKVPEGIREKFRQLVYRH